jgi:imidazolonepropionase-like amidohydrolase
VRNVWSRNTGRVVWLESSGGALQDVVSAPSDNRLRFTADGERLLYIDSIRGGGFGDEGESTARSRLMSVRMDGTDRRHLATISAEAYEIVPSPDMRHVAFMVREDVYVAALPLAAEPPTIGERTGPGPVKRISREGGMDAYWEDNATLAWSFANKHYRLNAVRALAAGTDTAAARVASAPDTIAVAISVPRAKPSGSVVLRGADIITMRGDEVIRNGAVVVVDNRITWVGPASEVSVPSGAQVVDVTGKTLMPGLVDMHAHLRPPRDVFVQSAWPYLANLAFGVTTTRDVSSSNDGFAYHELVETGEVLGPRIFTTGRAMTSGNARIESLEDARASVRHYKQQGTSVIKQYAQPHRRQRQWVLMAAKEEGLNATNEGIGDHRLNLGMVLDGFAGFEHALPIADIYSDVTRLIAESRTWYVPTLVVAYGGPTAEWYFYRSMDLHANERLMRFIPHPIVDRRTRRGIWYADEEYNFRAVAREAAEVFRAGGHIGAGGHGEEQGISVHWELWALQMGGLTNHEALRVATALGAEGIGMARDLGSVEAGKLADLVVLDSSPLEDIRNSIAIRYVMKNGQLFEAETLTQVWPEHVELPDARLR